MQVSSRGQLNIDVKVNRSLSSLTCLEPYVCDMNKADNVKVAWARWGRAVLEDLANSRAVQYSFLRACLFVCHNTVTVHYFSYIKRNQRPLYHLV